MTSQVSTLQARIAELEKVCKAAHSVIEGMGAIAPDYERTVEVLTDGEEPYPPELCFGGFVGFAEFEARFGEPRVMIAWPDLGLVRDELARVLQVGGP